MNTYDIQNLTIALLLSGSAIAEDDKKRLDDMLTELNNLCIEENDYTLSVTVG